ncbi:MAG TPA: Ig-like domain-containing protein, partial [Cytophagales bacterium]
MFYVLLLAWFRVFEAWFCKGLSLNRATYPTPCFTRPTPALRPFGPAGWLTLLLLLAVPDLAAAAAPAETARRAAESAYAGPLRLRGASAFGPGTSRASLRAYAVDFTNLSGTRAAYGAALPFNNCTPISTLPCTDIVVNTATPFVLNFNGAEGGLADGTGLGTGFRMVDPPSARLTVDGVVSNPAVPGYEPSRLRVVNGRLNITANRGIAFLTPAQSARVNSQLNALGVGVDANARKLSVETTVVAPFTGDKAQQAGLWYGLNEDNFVKLVVVNGTVEMRRELNGQSISTAPSPDLAATAAIPNLSTSTVKLRFQIDNVAKTIRGFYAINGGAEVQVGGTGFAPGVPTLIAGRTVGDTPGISFAGIYTSYRNMGDPNFTTVPAGVPVYAFEDFRVQSAEPVSSTLAFTPASLSYVLMQGGTAAPQTATLSASAGTPAVALTKTANSDWLTLPAGGLGALSFGVNAAGLAPGVYNTTVTAAATGYANAVLPVTLTVQAPPVNNSGIIKVNFQDPPTIPPAGWLRDYGMAFGPRTAAEQASAAGSPTYTYGWKKRTDGTPLDLASAGSTPGNGRNRIAGTEYDNATEDIKVRATLMHMQANDLAGFSGTPVEGYWEMEIPNGTYDVTVTAGDYAIPTSTEINTLNVEGKNAINAFVPEGEMGAATRFATGTVRVTVADGALTINANEMIDSTLYKGTNAKITGVQIKPASALPYLYWSASTQSVVIEANTAENSKTFAVELSRSNNQEAVQMNLTATYSSGGSGWLSFNATHNGSEPSVTFDYTAAKTLPVGTHTATVTASASGYSSATLNVQVTVGAPGTIRPYVVASTPADGATNVSLSPTIAANSLYVPNVPGFKGGVDNSTITTSTVKLIKVAGGTTTEMLGTVQGTGGGDAISFTPTYALEPFTLYKFVITEGVKSYSGASFQPYEAFFTTGAPTSGGGDLAVEFKKSPIAGTQNKKYTSITFGPDGKFYALRLDGTIERYTVDRTTGLLSGMEEIQTLITKHGSRSAVGLAFDPASTTENLIAWVSHCSAGLDNAPLFDGNLSRLSGPSLENEQHVLTKLPRSMKDHLVNSIVFGPDKALYFNQGSNSSMGVYDNTWKRAESLL